MPYPTKLTEDVSRRIVLLIRAGNYVSVAAEAACVHRSTVYAWLERGEADSEAGRDTGHSRFAQAFTRAQAEAQVRLVAAVLAVAPHDWRAAAWMLERRFPESWGRPVVRETVVERCWACGRRERIRPTATRVDPPEPPLNSCDELDRWVQVAEVLRDLARGEDAQ